MDRQREKSARLCLGAPDTIMELCTAFLFHAGEIGKAGQSIPIKAACATFDDNKPLDTYPTV